MTEKEALQKLEDMDDPKFMAFLDSLPLRVSMMVKARMVNWREVLPLWYLKKESK